MKKANVQKMVISAMFLSLALVFKLFFSFYIPIFGQSGISVGLSGIFSIMPSILFGPWYGMAVSALVDVMGHILKPAGPYMPLLTITAALGGFLRGQFWLILKNANPKALKKALAAAVIFALLFGGITTVLLYNDGMVIGFLRPQSYQQFAGASVENFSALGQMLLARTAAAKDPAKMFASLITYLTAAPLVFAGLGTLLLCVNAMFKKYFCNTHLFAIFMAVIAAGLIVTTLNTWVLREVLYTSWKALPFVVVWLPRALEEVLMGAVKAYIVSVLYNVFLNSKTLAKTP